MTPSEFVLWFLAQLEELGPGFNDVSNEELRAALRVSISSETLRKIKGKRGYSPSSGTIEELEAAINRKRRNAFLDDAETSILQRVHESRRWTTPIISILRSPNFRAAEGILPCDVTQQKIDAPFTFIYRIIDLQEFAISADSAERILLSSMQSLGTSYPDTSTFKTIITDKIPTARLAVASREFQISIVPLQSFIKQIFPVDEIEANIKNIRSILETSESYRDFPCLISRSETNENISKSPLSDILADLNDQSSPMLVLVIGPYGTGKSSLLAEIAHRLFEKYRHSDGHGALPNLIPASQLKWSNLEVELAAAWSGGYLTGSLHQSVVFDLIRMGLVCLLIDGLDEQVNLRDPGLLEFQIKEQLSALFTGSKGKVILSVRSEIFVSADEQNAFEHQLRLLFGAITNHDGKFVICRTQLLEDPFVEEFASARLGRAKGHEAWKFIQSEPALSDLARRPIFAHMILSTEDSFSSGKRQWTVSQLFKRYVDQWCTAEQRKAKPLLLSSEQRQEWCVTAAEYLVAHKSHEHDGFTAAQLVSFVQDNAERKDLSRSVGLFQNDARVAMFLRRTEGEGGLDHFDFSHESLYDYFIARAIVRQLGGRNGLRLQLISNVVFDKVDKVLPTFVKELLVEARGDEDEVETDLTELLDELLDWGRNGVVGIEKPWSLASGEFRRPPFGPGGRRHVLANVLTLLSLGEHGRATRVKLDLRGAHLGGANISCVSPAILESSNLNGANLEFVNSAMTPEELHALPVLTDLSGKSTWSERHKEVAAFCQEYDLLRDGGYSRHFLEAHRRDIAGLEGLEFFTDRNVEWVLIPGGVYNVRPANSSQRSVKVRICSFLIQRFPVTNGQFAAFLRESRQWTPTVARDRDDNPYYLYGWPDDNAGIRGSPAWRQAPVVYISWYAARDFAHSQGLRLPTEVEWEIAARIFHRRVDVDYQWDKEFSATSEWLHARGEAEPLEEAVPNFSVFDDPPAFKKWMEQSGADVPSHLVGGVKEWVLDEYAKTYPYPDGAGQVEGQGTDGLRVDPFNSHFTWEDSDGRGRGWEIAQEANRLKVLRGGSFQMPIQEAKIDWREQQKPTNVNPDAGFRCILPIRSKRG